MQNNTIKFFTFVLFTVAKSHQRLSFSTLTFFSYLVFSSALRKGFFSPASIIPHLALTQFLDQKKNCQLYNKQNHSDKHIKMLIETLFIHSSLWLNWRAMNNAMRKKSEAQKVSILRRSLRILWTAKKTKEEAYWPFTRVARPPIKDTGRKIRKTRGTPITYF